MVKMDIKNSRGEVVGERELPQAIFSLKSKDKVIHEAVKAAMSNLRVALAHTKTKGEVRGGGRKPWKQKGTGRARHGSIRSPIWRGGGVIFGPRNERNFEKKINKKAKRLSLMAVLANKASEGRIKLVDMFPEINKTREARDFLKNLELDGKRILILTQSSDLKKPFGNIPGVNTMEVRGLNGLEMLKHEYILADSKGIEELIIWLDQKKK